MVEHVNNINHVNDVDDVDSAEHVDNVEDVDDIGNIPPPPPIPLPLSRTFTIVALGESGVGKSTLISGLTNYFKYPNYREAKKHYDELDCCIPIKFIVQYKDKKPNAVVEVGDFDKNENFNETGQAVTQEPRLYQFRLGESLVNVIDTPGLSDSRGSDQDSVNLELIREIIHRQSGIDAILIVLKSNESRLRSEFELATRELLSVFPKTVLKNVLFFFTYCIGMFYGIGDSFAPLSEFAEKFNKSHKTSLDVIPGNSFCIDSETFKYLLAKKKNVEYSTRPESDFEQSWNESSKNVREFVEFLSDVKQIKRNEIVESYNLEKLGLAVNQWYSKNGNNLSRKDKKVFKEKMGRLLSTIVDASMSNDTINLRAARENYKMEGSTPLKNNEIEQVKTYFENWINPETAS